MKDVKKPTAYPQQMEPGAEETYTAIRGCVIAAQNEIGEQVYRACWETDRAGYGERLLQYLSDRLTAEFGSGFTVANLRNMR